MNIITVGFCGTGSSAIEDILLEYDNCTVGKYNRFEHVLFYIPDGLFDLEDRIVYNNSFHMFDGAIKRFYDAMKRLNDNDFHWFGGYQRRTGSSFMTIVNEFIESLIQYRIEGYWSDDMRSVRTVKGSVKDLLFSKGHLDKSIGMRNKVRENDDETIFFSFLTREQFLEKAKVFVKNYLNLIRKDCSEEHFIFDQLILPQHLNRVNDYFDNETTRVILVDRDPRDLYVLSKYVWTYQTGRSNKYFPDNVQEYITFHRAMRQNVDYGNNSILYIKFEDLVYDYYDSLVKIEKYLSLSDCHHKEKGKYFVIEKSIKNTQNFLINSHWKNEIEAIEKQLPEYIYKFPYQIVVDLNETSDP